MVNAKPRLTTEQLEEIRKNAIEASGLPFTAWTVSRAVERDIPKLLAEVTRLKHVLNKIRAGTFCDETLDIVENELVGIAPLTLAEQLEEDEE